MLSKLGLYLRISLDPNGQKPKALSGKVVFSDGSTAAESSWEQPVIDKAFSDAKANEMPIVGLILKICGGPFFLPGSGKITAMANIDGTEYLAGVLNVVISPSASAPRP